MSATDRPACTCQPARDALRSANERSSRAQAWGGAGRGSAEYKAAHRAKAEALRSYREALGECPTHRSAAW